MKEETLLLIAGCGVVIYFFHSQIANALTVSDPLAGVLGTSTGLPGLVTLPNGSQTTVVAPSVMPKAAIPSSASVPTVVTSSLASSAVDATQWGNAASVYGASNPYASAYYAQGIAPIRDASQNPSTMFNGSNVTDALALETQTQAAYSDYRAALQSPVGRWGVNPDGSLRSEAAWHGIYG